MTTHPRSLRAALVRAANVLLAALALAVLLPPTRSEALSEARSEAALRARVVDLAGRYAGTPYRWGGTTPRGFDCSGFTRFVLDRLGKHLPRTARAQYAAVRKVGKHVRAGDLVFFYTGAHRVYHVGIYAGRHRVWHAARPGKGVLLERIWTTRWTGGRY